MQSQNSSRRSSTDIEILLLRFAVRCKGRQRDSVWRGSELKTRYDEKSQLTVVISKDKEYPAIDCDDLPALATKKCDIEKGEDTKDRWMWSQS